MKQQNCPWTAVRSGIPAAPGRARPSQPGPLQPGAGDAGPVRGHGGARRFPGASLRGLCLMLLLPFLCTGLGGCGGKAAVENEVQVFYLTAGRTALSARTHVLRTESPYAQVQELLELLAADPVEEGITAPIQGFAQEDFSIEKNTLILKFSASYREMDGITEKLTRAAIVNTMCALPEIRRVTIRVNGALLVDEHGNKSENMTADQFIYNSGSEMLNFERAEIHLFFASGDGKKLVETYRTVVFNGNIPMERLVVEQVISGPNGDFNYPTVNADTKVVNIVSRDNICSVTLDETFLTNPNPVDPEVAIYSIVNTLTELPSIRQVQIIIDGVEEPVFMDTYALDSEALLQKNTRLIQSRE